MHSYISQKYRKDFIFSIVLIALRNHDVYACKYNFQSLITLRIDVALQKSFSFMLQ